MPKRVPEDKIALIQRLYTLGTDTAEIARQAQVSRMTVWGEIAVYEGKIGSLGDHYTQLVANRGFGSRSGYQKYLADRQGLTPRQLQTELARRKGFISAYGRERHYNELKEDRPEYASLSKLIRERLAELGMSQSELARRLGLTQRAISHYAAGIRMPDPNTLAKLLHELK